MAKIVSQNIVITVSKIAKDSDKDAASLIPADIITTIEQVVQEMVGSDLVVEVFSEE